MIWLVKWVLYWCLHRWWEAMHCVPDAEVQVHWCHGMQILCTDVYLSALHGCRISKPYRNTVTPLYRWSGHHIPVKLLPCEWNIISIISMFYRGTSQDRPLWCSDITVLIHSVKRQSSSIIWYLSGAWSMVYGAWGMVHGTQCIGHGAWGIMWRCRGRELNHRKWVAWCFCFDGRAALIMPRFKHDRTTLFAVL